MESSESTKKTIIVKKQNETPEAISVPETENVKDSTIEGTIKPSVTYQEKADEALATAALKSVIETKSAMTQRDADRQYGIEKQKYMLNKFQTDKKVKFRGEKILAEYFGTVYTFYFNCLPVTVYFDGVEREYPEFVVEHIKNKIAAVSESNTYKENIEQW